LGRSPTLEEGYRETCFFQAKKKCPKEVFLTWSAREIASGKSFSWITLLGVIQISSQAIDCKKFENDELHFVGF
jgi:hypothetical protein